MRVIMKGSRLCNARWQLQYKIPWIKGKNCEKKLDGAPEETGAGCSNHTTIFSYLYFIWNTVCFPCHGTGRG